MDESSVPKRFRGQEFAEPWQVRELLSSLPTQPRSPACSRAHTVRQAIAWGGVLRQVLAGLVSWILVPASAANRLGRYHSFLR